MHNKDSDRGETNDKSDKEAPGENGTGKNKTSVPEGRMVDPPRLLTGGRENNPVSGTRWLRKKHRKSYKKHKG